MAKTKVELLTNLPSDVEARARLADQVESAVELMKDIADLKSAIRERNAEIREISKVEKEDRLIAPKYFKQLVKRRFDVKYAAERATAELEAQTEAFNEADILFNTHSEDE